MNRKNIGRILSGALLLSFIVFGFLTYRFLNPPHKENLKDLLPKETTFIAEFNGTQFQKTIFKDIVTFRDQYSFNVEELKRKMENSESSFPGADLKSGFVFFTDEWEGIWVYGLLVHIDNQTQFNKYDAKGSILKLSNKKKGIILYSKDETAKEQTEVFLLKAQQLLQQKVKKRPKSEEIINIHYNYAEKNLDGSLFLDKNRIYFKGIDSSNNHNSETAYIQVPQEERYLEWQSKELPKIANNFLINFLKKWDVQLPMIKQQQAIIYTTNVQTLQKKLSVLPRMDWLISFQEELAIDEVMSQANLPDFLHYQDGNFNVKEIRYIIQQLDSTTIYVSNHPVTETIKTAASSSFKLAGNLDVLLNIEGSGFLIKMIQALPPLQKSRIFLQEIEHFAVDAQPNNEENNITGELRIGKDKHIVFELLQLFL